LAGTGAQLVTISRFSRAEIARHRRIPPGEMPVFLWGALADATVGGAAHQDVPGDLR